MQKRSESTPESLERGFCSWPGLAGQSRRQPLGASRGDWVAAFSGASTRPIMHKAVTPPTTQLWTSLGGVTGHLDLDLSHAGSLQLRIRPTPLSRWHSHPRRAASAA